MFIAFTLVTAPTHRLSAQLKVFDLTNFRQAVDAFKQAKEQLKTVTDTLREVRSVVQQGKELLRILGDPRALLNALGLSELTAILKEVGEIADFGRKTMAEVAALADEVKSLTDARLNLFSSGRTLGLLVNGAPRDRGRYRGFAIFETQLSESNKVLDEIKPKLADLARRKSELTQRLQSVTTENEREAVRSGLAAATSAEQSLHYQAQAAQAQVMAADAGVRQARAKEREGLEEEEEILAAQAEQEARKKNAELRQRLFGR
ncbi:MAG: hypothetical protein JSR82_08040 [Verrucomicrobia bacterium]|nr:hypothetical protein [Verrucomicrobiota bacterium]